MRSITSAASVLLALSASLCAQYQVNTPEIGLGVDGREGTATAPLVIVREPCQTLFVQARADAALIGNAYNLLFSPGEALPAGGGALTTAGGQVLSLNLLSLNFTFPTTTTWAGDWNLPVNVPPIVQAAAFQMFVADPAVVDGLRISAPVEVHGMPMGRTLVYNRPRTFTHPSMPPVLTVSTGGLVQRGGPFDAEEDGGRPRRCQPQWFRQRCAGEPVVRTRHHQPDSGRPHASSSGRHPHQPGAHRRHQWRRRGLWADQLRPRHPRGADLLHAPHRQRREHRGDHDLRPHLGEHQTPSSVGGTTPPGSRSTPRATSTSSM